MHLIKAKYSHFMYQVLQYLRFLDIDNHSHTVYSNNIKYTQMSSNTLTRLDTPMQYQGLPYHWVLDVSQQVWFCLNTLLKGRIWRQGDTQADNFNASEWFLPKWTTCYKMKIWEISNIYFFIWSLYINKVYIFNSINTKYWNISIEQNLTKLNTTNVKVCQCNVIMYLCTYVCHTT